MLLYDGLSLADPRRACVGPSVTHSSMTRAWVDIEHAHASVVSLQHRLSEMLAKVSA